MKPIGVVGGLGPQATMDFEARVHEVSQRLVPQSANSEYPAMVQDWVAIFGAMVLLW